MRVLSLNFIRACTVKKFLNDNFDTDSSAFDSDQIGIDKFKNACEINDFLLCGEAWYCCLWFFN